MVAQGGGVFVGIAANIAPIAAVADMLSLGHSPSQAGVNVGTSAKVDAMAAVAVRLSLGHNPSQAVGSTGSVAGPQEGRSRVRLARRDRKRPGNFVFMICLSAGS